MSLLNNALREAEQRRQGPAPAAAYVGQGASAPRRSSGASRGLWPGLVLVVIIGAIVAALLWPRSAPVTVTTTAGPEPVTPEANTAPAPSPAQPDAELQTSPAATADPDPRPPASGAAPESGPTTVVAAPVPVAGGAAPVAAATKPTAPAPRAEPSPAGAGSGVQDDASGGTAAAPPRQSGAGSTRDAPAAGSVDAAGTGEAAQAPEVRQQRQTPQARDRETGKAIRQALAAGRPDDAERLLAALVASQDAPLSRSRLARHLLINGQADQALQWLPADIARDHAPVRLLRGRALLAKGQARAAAATLESAVPAVRENVEYSVTLAALLQQLGRHGDAAMRWGELIAHDNTRGPWWVGLAIALEADARGASAARAYEQALALPDLTSSLADYCRQRLNALRAG